MNKTKLLVEIAKIGGLLAALGTLPGVPGWVGVAAYGLGSLINIFTAPTKTPANP